MSPKNFPSVGKYSKIENSDETLASSSEKQYGSSTQKKQWRDEEWREQKSHEETNTTTPTNQWAYTSLRQFAQHTLQAVSALRVSHHGQY